ncbi:MAG: IS1380 family transposase, partial [Blastocatellia bacterium]
MNKRDHKRLKKRKRALAKRLERKNYAEQSGPMMKQERISYEMGERAQAMCYGGIGAIHKLVGKLGLAEEINRRVKLLKAHLPYYESDHVLNIAYNVMCGGQC